MPKNIFFHFLRNFPSAGFSHIVTRYYSVITELPKILEPGHR